MNAFEPIIYIRNVVFLLLQFQGSGLFGQQVGEGRKIEDDLTKKTLDHIYNLQYNESEKSIRQFEKAGKAHIVDFLKALQTYWIYMPLHFPRHVIGKTSPKIQRG